MWKFIGYFNLSYQKLEKKLSDYEKKGFRLEKVKFGYFFKFKKISSIKAPKYICLYHLPRETHLVDFDYQLKKHHNAIQVQTDFFTNIEIYRITSKINETKMIENEIKKYFLHCSFSKILLSLVFLAISAISIFGMCMTGFKNLGGTYFKLELAFLSIVSTLSIVSIIKNLFIIRYLKKKGTETGDGGLSCQ